ncbi:uncharacterized protein LOC119650024 [Hermetia illucens]|uniref:uncharacterized protein LOC119650024 n=1 Tax=Hermetia illucens TaxID=343691 RepID=UPI0018CC2892|nr:uncharacterized protein LOC119650024 [Hermetia illucens]
MAGHIAWGSICESLFIFPNAKLTNPSFIGWPQSKRNKYTYIHGKHFQQSPSMKHTRIIIIEKENGKFNIKKSNIGHRYSIEIYIHRSVSDDLDIKRIGLLLRMK